MAAGPEDDPPWIATAYVPGPSLAEAVARSGPLAEDSVWQLAAGLAEALGAIHAEGLIHRDLKPSNVLLAADGPRVIDFGIARAMEATVLTGTGTTIGTPGYMAPEQAEGRQVGPQADVFSLGAVLAFAANGREPFGQGSPLGILHRVVNGEPQLDGLPERVRALVATCLAKNPADRPTPAQLLVEIAGHWDPPEEFPHAPPWSEAVTALIQYRGPSTTAQYTAYGATPPSHHSEPTHTPPPRSSPTPAGQGVPDTKPPAGPVGESAREPDPEHLQALNARAERAGSLGEAGDHMEAARLHAEVAAERARVLGPDHYDTLLSRHLQAWELGLAGECAEAARLYGEVAVDSARVLGPDHTDTLNARCLHGTYVGEAGEHAEAVRLLAGVVADRARVLGADHPDALAVRSKRAGFVGAAGDHVEAARLHAELALDQARALGADHYDTLLSRHLQAWELGQAGEHGEAARLYAEVATDSARVLGPDHPDSVNARSGHAVQAAKQAEATRSQG
ncbi:protein kinase [Streptomyces sp. NPDC001741]|uniref:protein kinase domain-containing protein n=1 Tax=Streptomyces sp. NPDC001741 TaxID=3364605 RepID=UPI00369D718F